VSLAIVTGGLWLLNREVQVLAQSYGSAYRLPLLSPGDALAIVAFAGLIGWLGAYLSVNRHLREMEPG
jgi:cell division transport system permease protein